MKTIIRNYGIAMNAVEKQQARSQAVTAILTRGTGRTPGLPRDLVAQPGPRGVLLNWRAPEKLEDVAGYRVYKDDETKLFAEIKNPNASQFFVESTADTTSPMANFFVSTVNKLGMESNAVQVQGSAKAETGAPSMPSTPPTYTTPFNPANRNPRVRSAGQDI